MKKHIYYKLELQADSPISVGAGQAVYTDCDVYKDAKGDVVIPSSSLAGVYRSFFDATTANLVFGYIKDNTLAKSKVIIYDAKADGKTVISVRDGVSLDQNKVAVDGAKFDREIVESGIIFVTYIEIHGKNYSPDVENAVESVLQNIKAGNLSVGGKQTRGYGKLSLKKAYKKCFDIESEADQWLDFDVFDSQHWSGAEIEISDAIDDDKYININMKLRQRGGIAIRSYVAEAKKENKIVPDYEQLKLSDDTKVIPGTSWAGAFRAQFKKLGGNPDRLFGFSRKEGNKTVTQKSAICFSESKIKDGKDKILTRNSIDRFSAGTKDGALFTERSYYNGATELQIKIVKSKTPYDSSDIHTLLACIMDLHNGYMAVGGLTAVGRGIFSVEHLSINGKDCTKALCDNNYELLKEVCL